MATCSDRADSEVSFTGAIAFSLEKFGLPDVSLKAEQLSAIYQGNLQGTGSVCLYGLWEEPVLPDSTLRYTVDHKDNRTQASAVLVLCLHSSLSYTGPTVKRAI